MEIKQLKLNGEKIYPKVAIDSIVGEDGSSKVDTTVTENSGNLVTSGAVYDAIQSGTGHSVAWENVTGKPNFATVSTTGNYSDLNNTPDLSVYAQSANLASVATSGNYNDLSNKPNLFSGDYNDLTNKPSIPAAQIQSDWNQTNDSAVDYIKNKPTIPAGVVVDDHLDSNSTNPVQNKVINGVVGGLNQDISGKVSSVKVGNTTYNPASGVVSLPAYPIGDVTKVSYSNNAGDFTPDQNGVVTLTIDQTLNEDSGRPVTNAAVAIALNEVEETMNGIGTLANANANDLTNVHTDINAINSQITSLSGNIASILEDVDTAVDKIELVDHAVDSVTQKTVQYTTIGGLTPTTLFDIDYKVKKGSYNPVASQAVYAAIDNAFKDLPTQYSKGIYLTEVLNYISHVETVAGSNIQATFDMSGQISWFNACGDSGQTDRLVKKQYSFGYVPVTTETTPWHTTVWSNAQVWVDEINNRNNTDFVINGAPLLELNEVSSGRYEISIDIKLVSAKYQVVSIDNLVFYYNGTQLSQAAPAVQSIDRTYTYSQSRDGIYIDSINNEVVACINSMWYKIADLETSPIKPLS